MKNMLTKNKWLLIVLSATCGVVIAFIMSSILTPKEVNVYNKKNLVTFVDSKAQKLKLDAKHKEKLWLDALFYHIYKAHKDAHSIYMDPKMYAEFNQDLNQTLVGIGIVSSQTNNALVVKRVYNNTPAQKANINEDDQIIGVNNVEFKNVKNKLFVDFIKGQENSLVKLKIKRHNHIFTTTLKRKSLVLPQVYAKKYANNLYVNISSFGENVYNEFKNATKELATNKKLHLIIDLRNNGGGSLSEVEKILSLFVKEKTPIVIKKAHNNKTIDYASKVDFDFSKVKIKVLVNQNSASASEILTIVLKELKHAIVIGSQTYGKGSVQQLVPLNDNSAFKFTIEKWYSPLNHGIDKIGIKPTLKVENPKSWYNQSFTKASQNDQVLKKALGV